MGELKLTQLHIWRLGEIGTFSLFRTEESFIDEGFELRRCWFAPKPATASQIYKSIGAKPSDIEKSKKLIAELGLGSMLSQCLIVSVFQSFPQPPKWLRDFL